MSKWKPEKRAKYEESKRKHKEKKRQKLESEMVKYYCFPPSYNEYCLYQPPSYYDAINIK